MFKSFPFCIYMYSISVLVENFEKKISLAHTTE